MVIGIYIAEDIQSIDRKLIQSLRKKGHSIITWTVQDKSTYQSHKNLFDNYIFDGFTPVID